MAENALTAVIQEAYIQGISTRSVDGLVQAMPSVGDPESSGSACRRRSGVLGRAVAGDNLDAGMAPQPVGDCRPSSVGQQVDRASTVEIDEQRAVGSSFADGPIIDAHDRSTQRAVEPVWFFSISCGAECQVRWR